LIELFHKQRVCFVINNQRDAALTSLIYYSLRDHSTCFGCSLHPSSGIHKTVDAITGTRHVSVWCKVDARTWTSFNGFKPTPHRHMTCTCDCNYSFIYSWWWVQRTPETCRV